MEWNRALESFGSSLGIDDLAPDALSLAVNEFLAQVSVWKKKLAELCAAPGTENEPTEGASLDTMNNFGMFV